jgi:hypothetical protein
MTYQHDGLTPQERITKAFSSSPLITGDFRERIVEKLWGSNIDGARMGDELIDRIIGVLQKKFPASAVSDWEALLGDFRTTLVEEFRDRFNDLAPIDDVIDAAVEALTGDAP